MNTSSVAKQAAEQWSLENPISGKNLLRLDRRLYFALGYDAATAKLREELDGTRRERDCANDNHHAIMLDYDKLWDEAAKLREELERANAKLVQYQALFAHQQPSAPAQTMDNEVSFHSDWEGRTPSTDKCCPKCGAQLKGDGTHVVFSPDCHDAMVGAPAPEAGNHDCEYPSENEDARCLYCGLTSGEAVKYFEGLNQKQTTSTSDVEKIARETAYELFGEDEAKHEAIAVLHKALTQAYRLHRH